MNVGESGETLKEKILKARELGIKFKLVDHNSIMAYWTRGIVTINNNTDRVHFEDALDAAIAFEERDFIKELKIAGCIGCLVQKPK